MTTNWLPVVGRELQLAVRRSSTYYARVSAALLVAVTTLALVYAGVGGFLSPAAAGRSLFVTLSALGYLYVLLDGVLRTADCISEEKREGTLGLLFLTGLRSGDIICGKLISRILPVACNLIAGVPALGIALFLGGVTGADFVYVILTLVNGLFYASAWGMLISVMCRSDKVAFILAFSGIGILGIGLLLGGYLVQQMTGANRGNLWFFAATPGGPLWELIGYGRAPGTPMSYGWTLAVSHLAGWGWLAISALWLRFTWKEPTAGGVAFLWREARWLGGTGSALRRSRWMERNPLVWANEPSRVRAALWLVVVVMVCAVCGLLLWDKIGRWANWPALAAAALGLHLIFLGVLLILACRAPAEDRRTGVFELLCTTPLGPDLVVEGRQLAFKRQCLAPVMLMLIVDGVIVGAGWWRMNFGQAIGWTVLFLLFFGKWLLDLYVVSWVGFWQGLKARTTARAVQRTVGYLFVWRWFLTLLIAAVVGIATGGVMTRVPDGAKVILAVSTYAAITAATYLHFAALAQTEVKDALRVLAARQPDDAALAAMGWRGRLQAWWTDWFGRCERRRSSNASR